MRINSTDTFYVPSINSVECPYSYSTRNINIFDISAAKDLIARLLIHNYLHRATVKQALNNAWITEDVIELENAYRDRITLEHEAC